MKHLTAHLLIALALCCISFATEEPAEKGPGSKLDEYLEAGMEMAGIHMPYYDEDGNRKAHLHGGRARVLEGEVADITNLRIDVYEGKKVFMTIFAPQCFARMVEKDGRSTLLIYSEGDVLIDLEQMTITGKGFRFSSEENKFEVLQDAKVMVRESARNSEELKQ